MNDTLFAAYLTNQPEAVAKLVAEYQRHAVASRRLLKVRRAHGKAHRCVKMDGKLPTCAAWLRFEACGALVSRRRKRAQLDLGRQLSRAYGRMTRENEADWYAAAQALDYVDWSEGLRHLHDVAEHAKHSHTSRWADWRQAA